MTRTIGILLICAFSVACGGDPEARKQEYFASGNRYFEQEKYKEAILEYRNAVQIDERFGEARAKLAEAYARAGNTQLAFAEFVRAADLLPQDAEVQLTAGEYLLQARRFKDAQARADAALNVGTQNVRAMVLQANALAGLKEYDAAVAKINEAIALDPKRRTSYASLGAILMARGDLPQAEAAFQRAIEAEPSSTEARVALASFYWTAGRREEAEATLRAAHARAPKDLTLNRELAAFLTAADRASEAEQYLLAIAEAEPGAAADVALADYYLATSRADEAVRRLERLGPIEEPLVKYTLARAYAGAGSRPKAHALVDQLLQGTPRNADVLVLKADLLLADGDRDGAFERVKAAVEADPVSGRAQLALGRLFAARGDLSGAQQAFGEVLRLDPRATVAQLELAKLHLSMGASGDSLKLSRDALAKDPRNPAARLAVIEGLLLSGDLSRAENEIATLRATHPTLAALMVHTGTLAAAKNDLSRARDAYEQALKTEPGNFQALAGLVSLDLATGNQAAARSRIDAQLATRPNRPDLLLLAARASTSGNDLESAERFLRKATELDSSLLQAYSMLGELYVRQNRLEQAASEFENLAARQTRPVSALTMAGIIYQTQGKMQQARERYEKALDVDSGAGVAANNLAWIVSESDGNLDVALNLAQTATAAMPTSAKARDTLGWIFYRKRLFELAIPQFLESIRLDPQDVLSQYHLGLAYHEAGKPVEARQALERALKSRADFTGSDEARRILTELSRK